MALACLSLWVSWPTIVAVFDGSYAFDWANFIEAGERFGTGTLYEVDPPYAFRWSPVAAWLLGFVTLMPLWLWQVLHLAVLPLLRSWLLVAAVLVSYPFWFDVQTGNLMTFVAVLGVLALRGGRVATATFLVLTVLIPRPLMLPLAVWLLWQRPATRLPFAAFFVAHAAVVVALGYGAEWLAALTSVQAELGNAYNFGPSRFIGALWIPIGLALAAWLTWRGRLGLASVAISPYWLPYYFLMLLLEFAPPKTCVRRKSSPGTTAKARNPANLRRPGCPISPGTEGGQDRQSRRCGPQRCAGSYPHCGATGRRIEGAVAIGMAIGLLAFMLTRSWSVTDGDAYWNAAIRLRDGLPLYRNSGIKTSRRHIDTLPWLAWLVDASDALAP